MQRIIVDAPNGIEVGQLFTFDPDVSHHLRDVMRMRENECVMLSDGTGCEGILRVKQIDRKQVTGIVESWSVSQKEAQIHVTLIQGLPKSDKLEWIIQKVTEVGVAAIWPVQTARSIVQLDAKKADKKTERWNKIAREAAEQAHRAVQPTIESVLSFREMIHQLNEFDLILIAAETLGHAHASSVANHGLRSILQQHKQAACIEKQKPRIALLIGPEGGWTEAEVAAVLAQGGKAVSLGARILRTETAGLVGISAIFYEFGEYGG